MKKIVIILIGASLLFIGYSNYVKDIKDGFYIKNGKIFERSVEKDFLLENVSPINFDSFYIGNDRYVKDNEEIYLLKYEYGEPCGHHSCTLKDIHVIKIKNIENKSFSIYNKEKQIIKIDEELFVLNNAYIYEININNPKFNELQAFGYTLSENKIIYNPNNNELENADVKTFKFIGGGYFVDEKGLYRYGRKIDLNFDYETIKAFESGLLKDRNGIYMEISPGRLSNKINLVDDLESFEKIACKDRGCYFKDKSKVYYHWGGRDYFENFNADASTFEYIENGLAKDKNNLYITNQIQKDIDVSTFEKLGYYSNFVYFKDRNNYYNSAGTWIKKIDEKDIPFPELRQK